MELQEARQAREQLEKDLEQAIRDRLQRFFDETGLFVQKLDLEQVTVGSLGESVASVIVVGIHATVVI